jgi:hypothetical protein
MVKFLDSSAANYYLAQLTKATGLVVGPGCSALNVVRPRCSSVPGVPPLSRAGQTPAPG